MIRAAVIGAGRVAQQHLACLAAMPDVSIVGVSDLSRVMAEAAADRFKAAAWFIDHRRLLEEARPEVVHITTPVASHFALARDCLAAKAHVFLEKPATVDFEQFLALEAVAQASDRLLVEDYNYLYNEPVRRLLDGAANGELGTLVHADVMLCLNVLDRDYPASDPNLRSPVLDLRGGVVADFLPHLASLAHALCGPVRECHTVWQKRAASSQLPYDEFRALVRGERATATLAFSAHGQPDIFRVGAWGTGGRAAADIFENRFVRAYPRKVAKPLVPLLNALEDARVTRRSAWRLLWRKLGSGPGAYEGLWTLIRKMYDAVARSAPPPITLADMLEVNRLVDELKKGTP